MKEDQVGVDLYLEAQYIDVETCEPVSGLYVDIWNCNSTGTYSGVESGQGGLNSTFLRGIQETDEDGVVAFETLFPGHYDGRATHTHLLTKSNVTARDNGTVSEGAVTHIGQLFYPETLIDAVEAVAPYSSNTVERTTNDEDMWSIIQADATYDPFPEFVYLGDSIEDGLLAWIQIGVNASADYSDDDYYAVAATYYEGGGVANADSGFVGGGGGNGTGNGTAPSGAIPSGAVPTDLSSAATDAVSTSVSVEAAATSVATSVAAVVSSEVASSSGILPSGAARPSGHRGGQQVPQAQKAENGKGSQERTQGQGQKPHA